VILLRRWIQRTLERRWLGLLLLVLFGLLLGFVALHPITDEFVHSAALVCAVMALLAYAVVLAFRFGRVADAPAWVSARGSPRTAMPARDVVAIASQVSSPLRR